MNILDKIIFAIVKSSVLTGLVFGGLFGLLFVLPLLAPKAAKKTWAFIKARAVAAWSFLKARKDLYGFRVFVVIVALFYPILFTAAVTYEAFKGLREYASNIPADLKTIVRGWKTGDFHA